MNTVAVMLTSGVPVMTPLLKFRPVGNAGEMPHASAEASLPKTGPMAVTVSFRVMTTLLGA